ncbi:SOS response-associated peptidase [Thalassospira alkalitolerans]|uniref:SOS response-associated peptidase n=1 Tax=Thalassospira alkalitolerans TaxID=1293890 RepID=UPI0030EC6459|tara:strand:+ start:69452 stop:70201 length:750 start_codon:yes stop_codon:yes gene_type:complete
MCSRYDLNSDIYSLQARFALDLCNILRPFHRMSEPGVDDDRRNEPERSRENRAENKTDKDNGNKVGPDLDAAFESLSGTRRPTDPVIVILAGNTAGIRNWGLTISTLNTPLINARAETLDQKPTFRPLLERRCLVPATGWYEWRKDGRGKHKTAITLPGHQPFLFAGLENGSEVTIITCRPANAIAHIHDRMPAVIGPNHIAGWLNRNNGFADVRHMLGPVPDHVLNWHEDAPGIAQPAKHDDGQIDLL